MCYLLADVFGVGAAICTYPLGNLLTVAFEIAHGAPMYFLEGFPHCNWTDIMSRQWCIRVDVVRGSYMTWKGCRISEYKSHIM